MTDRPRILSAVELSELYKYLDSLIEEAKSLQTQINGKLLDVIRRVQPDHSGQPRPKRRIRR
jgi:hypothetical protein